MPLQKQPQVMSSCQQSAVVWFQFAACPPVLRMSSRPPAMRSATPPVSAVRLHVRDGSRYHGKYTWCQDKLFEGFVTTAQQLVTKSLVT